jgi:hypothetical protein
VATALPPSKLSLIVAGTAAAVLFTEIVLTRLFSVLLYYHYSFLAVGMALFGLAGGAVVAARTPALGDHAFAVWRLRRGLAGASVTLVALAAAFALLEPSLTDILIALLLTLLSSVPLVLLGEVLARALALGRDRVFRLYALDLCASAVASLTAIPLLERLQGPVVLVFPAFIALALLLPLIPSGRRWAVAAGLGLLGLVMIGAALDPGPLVGMGDSWVGRPVLERWNSHSRVRVSQPPGTGTGLLLVIDRTAQSSFPLVPALRSGPPGVNPAWLQEYPDPSYAAGRPTAKVAIIGVGGGPDILPALAAGAEEVDGYEVNGRIVELLTSTLVARNAIALRPDVHIRHDEARHGLEHHADRYDLIRANLIDTWAATAAGGFVLSENGLYTLEAWRLFLQRLKPGGMLVMTRWLLPGSSAEAQRLVSLAAESLEREGLTPAGSHLVALSFPTYITDRQGQGTVARITTLISPAPFTSTEVASLAHFTREHRGTVLLAPGAPPAPEAAPWLPLLDGATRGPFIAASPWAIDPPTDVRPFFFLQLRPGDLLKRGYAGLGPVSAITINGVKILSLSVILSGIGSLILLIGIRRVPTERPEGAPWSGRVFFAMIGLGYMGVQLALHQRLAIILGRPTITLATVLSAMLLGTGCGSALAGTAVLRRRPRATLLIPLLGLSVLWLAFPLAGELSRISSLGATMAAAAAISFAAGVALGVALPTGLALYARSEAAVAESWAVNGAFSVLGSSLAAFSGLLFGSQRLVALAVPCYLIAWLAAALHQRPPANS